MAKKQFLRSGTNILMRTSLTQTEVRRGGAPEAVVLEQDIVGLQHEQLGVVLLLHVLPQDRHKLSIEMLKKVFIMNCIVL